MPLDKSAKCEGFWSNVRDLQKKFESDGVNPTKARKRAIAASIRTMKDSGGDPQKCLASGE